MKTSKSQKNQNRNRTSNSLNRQPDSGEPVSDQNLPDELMEKLLDKTIDEAMDECGIKFPETKEDVEKILRGEEPDNNDNSSCLIYDEAGKTRDWLMELEESFCLNDNEDEKGNEN
jgi:hypothetical protein